jgi:hypothetical protein
MIVLIGLVYLAHKDGVHALDDEREATIEKLNRAAVIALSASKAGATIPETELVLRKVTDANSIEISDSPSGLVWASNASAELQWKTQPGEVPILDSFIKSTSGKAIPYAEYAVGKVVEADLTRVVLQVGAQLTRVYLLTNGTLPPAVNSEVVLLAYQATLLCFYHRLTQGRSVSTKKTDPIVLSPPRGPLDSEALSPISTSYNPWRPLGRGLGCGCACLQERAECMVRFLA